MDHLGDFITEMENFVKNFAETFPREATALLDCVTQNVAAGRNANWNDKGDAYKALNELQDWYQDAVGDELLRAAVDIHTFSYDPGGRRDPFPQYFWIGEKTDGTVLGIQFVSRSEMDGSINILPDRTLIRNLLEWIKAELSRAPQWQPSRRPLRA